MPTQRANRDASTRQAMGHIRTILARSHTLKTAYSRSHQRLLSLAATVSPELLMRLRFRAAWGRWPDLGRPVTFDEKLIWLNLYWRAPLKTECGDKYTVRLYAERLGLSDLMPELYGVFDRVGGIELSSLPDRFVLKCTHGCKCNVFCPEKASLDFQRARRNLRRWLATDYSKLLGELHYAAMTPRIICEEFLDDGSGGLPTDYKVYCFGGKAHCTLVCSGRQENTNAKFDYLDRDWKLLPYDAESIASRRSVVRPRVYERMIAAAEALSAGVPFVRVDFYCIGDRLVLGEMTFTPSACIDTTYTEMAVNELGSLVRLPDRHTPTDPGSGRRSC